MAVLQCSHRVGSAGTDPAQSVTASAGALGSGAVPRLGTACYICRMRKTLLPDPGAPSPWESTDGLLVKVWAWKLGALDAFPGYIRNLLCGTTYFCAHVSSYSFSLARRFFQTFHLAARMCFSFCRVLFSDSKASWCAVTSTWTRHPLLPRLLLPLHPSHQSLPSLSAAAVWYLLLTLLTARILLALLWECHSQLSRVLGWVLRAEPAAGRLQPLLGQACWQQCWEIDGCDSQPSCLTQPRGFLLWTE